MALEGQGQGQLRSALALKGQGQGQQKSAGPGPAWPLDSVVGILVWFCLFGRSDLHHPLFPMSAALLKKTFDNAVENIYIIIIAGKLYRWSQ